ncbi:uncharacterized protein LOC131438969 [Malaya genurostris]|uniref:uncharacterized protein LOC131438969 n=1 Tax=Malaya genurostris TaxID=325434 RepID=UPI0026F38055|nr:uncharacterized protein LOC131438969 [Malaya genurostris]
MSEENKNIFSSFDCTSKQSSPDGIINYVAQVSFDSGDSLEDIYEEIDWESLDIVKLLRSLGVCKNVIKKFIDNGYDIELLKVIQRKEIETLVCEPYLADRTRIISGLNSWRISQNLPPISSPLKSSENVSSTHRSPMKSENCTASFLLNNSARGKRILKVYEETKVLSKTDRRNITHIVIDE